ncbi:MAG TPA: aminotransferase class IV [Streptosporangiaceae bacterium]
MRLTLTRGVKITSGMDPRLNQAGPTLIVLAEYKDPVYDESGITLVTASVRRPAPDCLDPKIHHNNLLPSILAKIEANVAGADDAVMLDHRGFIAETNATHIFMVNGGTLATPTTVSCPEGITRAAVLELAAADGIACETGDYTLPKLYTAGEAFVTGTMGGLVPVIRADGRTIGDGAPGPVTKRLIALFAALTATTGTPVALSRLPVRRRGARGVMEKRRTPRSGGRPWRDYDTVGLGRRVVRFGGGYMAKQAESAPPQTKRRRNWTIGGALGGVASIVTIITFLNSNNGTSSSQANNVTTPTNQAPVSSASAETTSQGGIPSLDLGSWGGFVQQNNGATERFILNLSQGTPGSDVGSFSNQTANCQGTVSLNGVTTVTLNGTSLPAADLNLETTQNPGNSCTSSVEAYVASANGSTLVFEIVTAGTLQGSFQDPLSLGDLTH